jgi:hypothetical protein
MAARKTKINRLRKNTCKRIADLVLSYLNDGLAPRVRRQFDQHLSICPDCVAFLNTYRKTVGIIKSVRAEDLPEKVRRNILDFLHSRARRKPTSA